MSEEFPSKVDPFAYHPFLSLLPKLADLSKIENLSSSLYARLEKVQGELADSDQVDKDKQKLDAEYRMLRQVLLWINPQQDGHS